MLQFVMQNLQQVTKLFLLAVLVAWLLPDHACSQSSCSTGDPKVLQDRRIRALRANILAQLGLSESSVLPNATAPPITPEEQAVMESFNALRRASASLGRERERKCQSDEFFAKPVTSFVGMMEPEEVVSGAMVRREAGSGGSGSGHQPSNVLASYKIEFDFELSESLSTISRADLLLYQLPTDFRNTLTRDRRQYVEIRTVLESVGQRFVVEGKYIDIYDSGYQVFEITSAAKLWVTKAINGSVTLEVTVYCYSSLDCAQPINSRQPAKVSFRYDLADSDQAPRVIIISKNPIEVENQQRLRRQTENSNTGHCGVDQTTCCLQELNINFQDDLGFDFILAPVSFDANYCEGMCPVGPDVLTPRLFDFLSQLGPNNPASSVEPCCAGNSYKSLEILIKVDGAFVIEELQQVSVTSCKCA